jgi:GAF domain-containing protein
VPPALAATTTSSTVIVAAQGALSADARPRQLRSLGGSRLSSLSVPLPIQEDLIGALNVYSRRPEAFDEDDIRAGQTFAAYAAVAVANADSFASTAEMAENLRHAMASRATIEQAKGILMARGGVTPEQAFEMLVRASQRENRKLRQVATDLVERVQQRQPPAPPSGA